MIEKFSQLADENGHVLLPGTLVGIGLPCTKTALKLSNINLLFYL